jgi:hypothetical protein
LTGLASDFGQFLLGSFFCSIAIITIIVAFAQFSFANKKSQERLQDPTDAEIEKEVRYRQSVRLLLLGLWFTSLIMGSLSERYIDKLSYHIFNIDITDFLQAMMCFLALPAIGAIYTYLIIWRCPNCGSLLRSSFTTPKYCSNCGKRLTAQPHDSSSENKLASP